MSIGDKNLVIAGCPCLRESDKRDLFVTAGRNTAVVEVDEVGSGIHPAHDDRVVGIGSRTSFIPDGFGVVTALIESPRVCSPKILT